MQAQENFWQARACPGLTLKARAQQKLGSFHLYFGIGKKIGG